MVVLLGLLLLPAPASASSPASQHTLADRQIKMAQTLVRYLPIEPDGYTQLAAAYIQKARETGDFSFNAKADAALQQSLKLDSDNQVALKLQTVLLLTYHQFSKALEAAQHLQQLCPQDPTVYGAMTDALVELGDYQGAIAAAKKMMDLRPDASAYARLSYLRALHGDPKGAIAAMRQAIGSANPRDPEGMAWYRLQLGQELLNAGKLLEGEREIDSALQTFPNYHLALAAKARARLAAGDLEEAVTFYEQALERVPLPDTAIALGDLYTKLGNRDAAQRQYDLVEFIEQTSAELSETYSPQLARFWANHDLNLEKALAIARRERLTRSDIYTFDVLAWCLFKQGELSEAKAAIDQAMRLGTRDAGIYYHAGLIYQHWGDRAKATQYLKQALQMNPTFDVLQADLARRALDEMTS
jgi:tetratricopeptide (TPR) repeat protein